MKRAVTALLLFGVCTLIAGSAIAQVPTIGIYFDREMTRTSYNCVGSGVIDTMFVGGKEFNTWISTVEFRVHFDGANLVPISEVAPAGALKLGTSYSAGTTINFPAQRNGYFPFEILKIAILWQCDDCGSATNDDLISVMPHAGTGNLEAIEFGTYQVIPATAKGAVSCGLVPTEQTSWGRVKALYK